MKEDIQHTHLLCCHVVRYFLKQLLTNEINVYKTSATKGKESRNFSVTRSNKLPRTQQTVVAQKRFVIASRLIVREGCTRFIELSLC